MTPLDSLREMFAALSAEMPEMLPAEVEVRLPLSVVAYMARTSTGRMGVVCCSGIPMDLEPDILPWLRIYEPWGCIYIRTLEG